MKLQFDILTKLTLVFVLFAAGLLAAMGIMAYSSGGAALETAATTELFSKAIEKQAALDTWVEERLSDVASLATSPYLGDEVAALMATVPGSTSARAAHDQLVSEFASRTSSGGEFLELMLLAPDSGEVLVSTDPGAEGKFMENRPYFINGRSGSYVQIVYFSTTLQAPAMTASAPVMAEGQGNGRLLAVLAGRLNLEELNAIISRRSGLHQTDDAYLVNTSNLFVTQPRFISAPTVLQHGIHTEAVDRCLAHNSGTGLYADYRGVPVISVYRWLPELQLCLIVEIDRAEAFAPVYSLGKNIAAIASVALLLATLLAYWLARTITRPVRKLTQGASEIGRGNLEYRLQVGSRDEIGTLAGEFNRMADSVSKKELQLSQRAAQLETANEELKAFSYSVSHDLRAPLRAMDGFSRILLEKYAADLDPEAVRYLNIVRDNTRQMGQLVDDLLAFSRLGRQALKKELVAPQALVNQALEDLSAELDGRKVEITLGGVSVAPGTGAAQGGKAGQTLPECQADPALLKQVFVNLLSNALKFTRTREVARVEIGFLPEGVYFVRDNGVGFDMQYADKLFGVFQRLHRPEEYEGTGVGLAIVQRIIHRHGGRVWVEAEVEKGATFYFTI
jgi:signal transduction histidine kinase